jgi:hypothetical protein
MKVTKVKDVIGQEYIGIDIQLNSVDKNGIVFASYLRLFNEMVDPMKMYESVLLHRNNRKYHITLFNVAEYNKLKKNSLYGCDPDKVLSVFVSDIEFKGIGSVNDDGVWFIVVKSKLLGYLREEFSLKPKDFHITIGLKDKDYFKEAKDESSIKFVLNS